MGKKRVGVIFGGKSVEHEISNLSAKKIIEAMDATIYDILPIGINKKGEWFWIKLDRLQEFFHKKGLLSLENQDPLFYAPVKFDELKNKVDIVFPVLHGMLGEDGAVQGLLRCLDIPFVGCDVLSSAICMDKEISKRILQSHGIKVVDYVVVRSLHELDVDLIIKQLGLPVFIKPANGGSSIGTGKATSEEEIRRGAAQAFQYDHKILIEKFILGKEIPIAVLGNDELFVSIPARIIPSKDFHTYETKYIDPNGFTMEIPLIAEEKILPEIQEVAAKAYKALLCEGLARVDLFLDEQGNIIVNELNTMPGFTPRSAYPLVMEASYVSRKDIVNRLIQLGIEKYQRDRKLETCFEFSAKELQLI